LGDRGHHPERLVHKLRANLPRVLQDCVKSALLGVLPRLFLSVSRVYLTAWLYIDAAPAAWFSLPTASPGAPEQLATRRAGLALWL